MVTAIFQLEPLTCPSCISKIERTLNKTSGVEAASVLFNSSKVRIQFYESQIEASKLEEIIQGLGYKVLSEKTQN